MSEMVDKAIIFATKKHSGQLRKYGNIPYILHPLEVAAIIGTMTDDEDVICAGLLHDTIEDTDTTPEEIREEFGSRIYALVCSETEDKLGDRPPEETWEERKRDSLLALQFTKDPGVKTMWLADKLSNVRSFYREYLKNGDDIWLTLNQKDKKKQEWYYRSILGCLGELKNTAAYREYGDLLDKLFGKNGGKEDE